MTNRECVLNHLRTRAWVKGCELQEVVHAQTRATGETIARCCRKMEENGEIIKRKEGGLVIYQLKRDQIKMF